MKSLLHQTSQLERLVEQTQLYQALLSIAKEALPEKLARHLIGVSFEQANLLLQIDDNLWVTKLRFYEQEILQLYQTNFPHLRLQRVFIKVVPIAEAKLPKKKKIEPPSQTASASFLELSENTEHAGLKQALERLSKRAKQPD